jgi:hypothetical protein
MMTNGCTMKKILEERIYYLKQLNDNHSTEGLRCKIEESEYILSLFKMHQDKEKEKLSYLYDY